MPYESQEATGREKMLIFQLAHQICAIRASNNNNKRDAHRIRRPRSNLSRCSTS